ncbi:uncharacterized protein LY89DRAFT_783413 [Mollisia scopiformis]|uniref:Uncharacterized protein n=1 Tax=Mollisia scopiformis TaxID=149040 RepID=A0A194X4W7_MOLSC|nr:uncharacterized protein LY89DRAFT_783413 [Mollisia scopiformis]KUJ15221.1 hypothetical protein LY89DRAFT_783413 [Mollisia scopiformis]
MATAQSWQPRQPTTPYPLDAYSALPSLHFLPNNGDSQLHPANPTPGFEPETLQKLFAEELRVQASISMCFRLERLLGAELQETFVLLETAEAGNTNKERGLDEAKKEIEHLNSMLEAAFDHKQAPVEPSSQSEESSDDGALAVLPMMPLKRKVDQLPGPSPKRPLISAVC